MAKSIKDGNLEGKVLRRDFLLGSGTVLAAGALTVSMPESAAALASSVTVSPETTPTSEATEASSVTVVVPL